MSFDLPLTAFALESSGAAARALGVCHTLTLPLQPRHGAEATRVHLALGDQADAPAANHASTEHDGPPTLTISF